MMRTRSRRFVPKIAASWSTSIGAKRDRSAGAACLDDPGIEKEAPNALEGAGLEAGGVFSDTVGAADECLVSTGRFSPRDEPGKRKPGKPDWEEFFSPMPGVIGGGPLPCRSRDANN